MSIVFEDEVKTEFDFDKNNGEWKFRAVGQGYNGGLRAMCGQYGISI